MCVSVCLQNLALLSPYSVVALQFKSVNYLSDVCLQNRQNLALIVFSSQAEIKITDYRRGVMQKEARLVGTGPEKAVPFRCMSI